MKAILERITGSLEQYDLRHRVLNISLLMASVLTFIGLISNLIIGIHIQATILTLFSFFYFLISYIIVYRTKNYNIATFIIASGVFLILFPLSWFINEGSAGSTIYFIFLAIVATYTMTEGRMRFILITIAVLSFFSLLILEYLHPELMYEYASRSIKYQDIITFSLISIVASVFYLNIYYDEYKKTNDKLRKSNELLMEAHKEMQEQQEMIWMQNKELNQQAEELKQANQAKDKLYSIIAHDLKSPFNSIIGFSELINKSVKNKDYEELEKYSMYLKESSENVYKLLLNLLDWSRIQRKKIVYKPEKINLKELITEQANIFNHVADEKNNKIELELSSSFVFADKNMLETIIRNLISNALKYTENGKINIKISEKNNDYIVEVKDNGIGMNENLIKNIFHTNETLPGTKGEKGSGLGLQLCKEFVEINKGTIHVKSEEGKGSTFTFSVPMYNHK